MSPKEYEAFIKMDKTYRSVMILGNIRKQSNGKYVYEGSKPDCKAFHQVTLFLSKGGMKIKGVILDSGFCTVWILKCIKICLTHI